MRVAELIAIAKVRSGKDQKVLAEEMGIDPTRLSNINKGKAKATASEIVYLAQQAQTDALRALADIESEREPRFAMAWNHALSALKSYFQRASSNGPSTGRRGAKRGLSGFTARSIQPLLTPKWRAIDTMASRHAYRRRASAI